MTWIDSSRLQVEPPAKPKKLTGTRFASVLGLNDWSTPFEIWCAVTRTYEKPFEDTIYTIAGKTIEPKQAAFIKNSYFVKNMVSPTDVYGPNYFKRTYGDFFHEEKIFGGMWDYLQLKDGKPCKVFEMKTTKRAEDWKDDIPEYYALQAALYAYLLHVDDVCMVVTFLEDKDYENPEDFTCTMKNTVPISFKLSERYPHFEEQYIAPALMWWEKYVETGISPACDEKRDAEILKVLRNKSVDSSGDMESLLEEAEDLKAKIDANKAAIKAAEDRYKVITKFFKDNAMGPLRDPGIKTVEIAGKRFQWVVTKSETRKIDEDALKNDGLYEKYLKTETTYKIIAGKVK